MLSHKHSLRIVHRTIVQLNGVVIEIIAYFMNHRKTNWFQPIASEALIFYGRHGEIAYTQTNEFISKSFNVNSFEENYHENRKH